VRRKPLRCHAPVEARRNAGHPHHALGLEHQRLGRYEPHKFHRWARQFGLRDGLHARQVLLNNWEATGPNAPVHPQGLDPERHYTLRELNPAPGRPALPQEGKTFTGAELMCNGITPSCSQALEACVIELSS
jgi:alpha-galactosidase